MDINEDEVRLLVNLPRKLCVIDKKEFVFAYGPYGFYGKYEDNNIRLPYKTVATVLEGLQASKQPFTCTPELIKSLKSSIDYHNEKKNAPDAKKTS